MRRIILSLYLTVLFIFLILILFSQNGSSETLHVGNGQEYSSIQDAINSANTSDTVYVHSGVYSENLLINKSISLLGAGKEDTTITGYENGNIIEIVADNVTISGFTIKNPVGSEMKCIKITEAENCVIQDNIIEDAYDGIYLLGSDKNIINDNTIKNHESSGILLYTSSNNQISNNYIQNNNNGITIQTYCSFNRVYQNTITLNSNYGVFVYSNCDQNVFYKNSFSDNGAFTSEGGGNAIDLGSNDWSYNSQGNYWDDYNDYDSNNDGIGDSPYDVDEDTQDQYPLGYFLNQNPVAYIISISPNPANEGETISFVGEASDDGVIIEYEWKANNNKISSQKSFSYSGLSAGTYTIKFRAKDDDGVWSDYDSETLTVKSSSGQTSNKKPSASIVIISPKTAEYGEEIYFAGKGTDNDGYITGYYWSSNKDGFLSSEQSFYKSDLSIGTHIISFKVKDNNNEWSDTVTSTVTVNPLSDSQENNPPVARINVSNTGYTNETMFFDASGSYDPDEDDTIVSYNWDFGDGNTGYGETVQHTYNSSGNFSVTLTVEDSHGDRSSTTVTLYVMEKNNIESGNNTKNNKWVIPGFEMFFVIFLAVFIGLFRKKQKN